MKLVLAISRKLSWWVPVVLLVLVVASAGAADENLRLGEERAAGNEAEVAARMIDAIQAASRQRHRDGPIKRFNQAKSLGCLDAQVSVPEDLPSELQQGVFVAGRSYDAKIRFANASQTDDREKDFRGMSIQLFGIEGTPLWGVQGEQHFLLNSHPALFAADPNDFLDFIEATRDDKVWRYFIRPGHFYSLIVVLKGREKIDNPFAIRYFSTTPYRFGMDRSKAVKYAVQACSTAPELTSAVKTHKDFLTETMQAHLRQAPACFDFMVQFQKDAQSMPIENAAVVWDEEASPFLKIATIMIRDQAFTETDHVAACEAMSFNPWQSLDAHRPLGGINRVRKAVYSEVARFRATENASRKK